MRYNFSVRIKSGKEIIKTAKKAISLDPLNDYEMFYWEGKSFDIIKGIIESSIKTVRRDETTKRGTMA